MLGSNRMQEPLPSSPIFGLPRCWTRGASWSLIQPDPSYGELCALNVFLVGQHFPLFSEFDSVTEINRSFSLIPYSSVRPIHCDQWRPVLFTPAMLSKVLIQKLLNSGGALEFNLCKPGELLWMKCQDHDGVTTVPGVDRLKGPNDSLGINLGT